MVEFEKYLSSSLGKIKKHRASCMVCVRALTNISDVMVSVMTLEGDLVQLDTISVEASFRRGKRENNWPAQKVEVSLPPRHFYYRIGEGDENILTSYQKWLLICKAINVVWWGYFFHIDGQSEKPRNLFYFLEGKQANSIAWNSCRIYCLPIERKNQRSYSEITSTDFPEKK